MDVVWPPSILNSDALTNVTTSLLKSSTPLTLSLRLESELYIMNTTEAPATINAGSALYGFGKLAFRQEGDGVLPFDPHKDVDFSPTSSSDHVLLLGANNEMTYETIGCVVATQSTQASKEKALSEPNLAHFQETQAHDTHESATADPETLESAMADPDLDNEMADPDTHKREEKEEE